MLEALPIFKNNCKFQATGEVTADDECFGLPRESSNTCSKGKFGKARYVNARTSVFETSKPISRTAEGLKKEDVL